MGFARAGASPPSFMRRRLRGDARRDGAADAPSTFHARSSEAAGVVNWAKKSPPAWVCGAVRRARDGSERSAGETNRRGGAGGESESGARTTDGSSPAVSGRSGSHPIKCLDQRQRARIEVGGGLSVASRVVMGPAFWGNGTRPGDHGRGGLWATHPDSQPRRSSGSGQSRCRTRADA